MWGAFDITRSLPKRLRKAVERREAADREVYEATVEAFPVGTKVGVEIGRAYFVGVVEQHAESMPGVIFVRNVKTQKLRKVTVGARFGDFAEVLERPRD